MLCYAMLRHITSVPKMVTLSDMTIDPRECARSPALNPYREYDTKARSGLLILINFLALVGRIWQKIGGMASTQTIGLGSHREIDAE